MQLLNFDPGLILWQLIVFVLLFVLLAKLAWKPIIQALKDRERTIQEALDAAERARQDIAKLHSDNEKLLKETREERDRILREARQAANQMKDEAQIEAKKAADKIIDDARAAIQIEKQAAMKDVRIQVATFALAVSEKLLKKNLSDDKSQNALVESYINELKLN